MAVQRMDNVGIVVDDLEAAAAFFVELGLQRAGDATVEGPWVEHIIALNDVRADIVMMRTPDGHSQLELTKFHSPAAVAGDQNATANTLGLRRIMFAVDDIREVADRLRGHGGELIGEITQFEDSYLLCYLRGPGGMIVALAEQLT